MARPSRKTWWALLVLLIALPVWAQRDVSLPKPGHPDSIVPNMIRAVDDPADEECLTYEATSSGHKRNFEWQTCGAGGGDNLTVNGSAVDTTGNLLDGDIDFTLVDGGAGGPDDITATVACTGCVDETDIDLTSLDDFTIGNGTSNTITFDAGATDPQLVAGSGAFSWIAATLTIGDGTNDITVNFDDGVTNTDVVLTTDDSNGGVLWTMTQGSADFQVTGDRIIIRDTSPNLQLIDTDTTDTDQGWSIFTTNCTDTGSGTEDCDLSMTVVVGGSSVTAFDWDADNGGQAEGVMNQGGSDFDFRIESQNNTDAFVIDAATDTATFNVNSGIAMTTSATECVMLDASAIVCDDTAGCATATADGTNFSYRVADFAAGADDNGSWTFQVPNNITGTTFVYRVFWFAAACTASTADDVCWVVSSAGIGNNEAWHTASLGTSQGVFDTCTTGNSLYVSPTSDAVTHGWVAGERAIVNVLRDVDAGHADCTDDNVVDARLAAVELCYEVNQVFSGE